MKLIDGGATVLIVFAAFYFAEWVVDSVTEEPEMCYYETLLNNGDKLGRWIECETINPA